ESETQAVFEKTRPRFAHGILYALAGMLVISLVLMSVVKLDRVVNAQGRIMPSQGSFFVQPLDRAIVTSIQVHTGDVVKKGQVLATLDPTFAEADLKTLQQKASTDAALVARLTAEQDGRTYAVDPKDPDSVLQGSIFAQRRAEYAESVTDFDARIASDQAMIERSSQNAVDYQQRLALASQAEQTHLTLQQKGYGSKLALLNATDTRIELQRMASESASATVGARSDMAALSAQRAAFVSKWRSDVATQLVAAQSDLTQTQQALSKASKVTDLATLVAPTDAVVLKVGKASIGSVVDPGGGGADPLFTLTPLAGPLDAEVRIDARDIGFIRPGDKVRVKLDAYRFTSHGLATGVIKTISDGSFTTTDDGQIVAPYYKARVAITNAQLRNVPAGFRLIPGLTIDGEVLVGSRTIMSYLFEGAMRTGSEAMREP
ncbi:MAG TPA: HlyD family type I secretion periplasmic adaptor subunit, partial [Caulobacteraceae bacterium]|nr:HlyD family type I secretion periplasmic adaptor subunit [Caulobacteraceae bacterium]